MRELGSGRGMTEHLNKGSGTDGAMDMTKIDAIDQISVSAYTLRGVSDSLLALSEQSHDYQDVMRMLSDVAFQQSKVLLQAETVLENELTSNSVVESIK